MTEETDPKRVVGRIVASMFLVGLGLGIASLAAWQWIESVIVPGVDGVSRTVIGNYTPLVFLLISTLSSVVAGAMLSTFEGGREIFPGDDSMSTLKSVLVVGLACLIGAVLLVVIAGIFISFTGIEVEGSESAEITIVDLLSLAGLAGITNLIIVVFTSVVAK